MLNSPLNQQTVGTGPHLIILHGLFGSLDNWKMIAKQLSEHYTVTSFDLPNHGQSPHIQEFDYILYAELVANSIQNVIQTHTNKDVILMGHSMGGKVAMQVAELHPDLVSELIVVDIAPKEYPPHHQSIISALQNIDLMAVKSRQSANEQLENSGIDVESTRQFLLKSLYKNDKKTFSWRFNLDILASQYHHIAQAPVLNQTFKKPVLFIKGQTSDYITAEDQTLINTEYPQATARIISGAGHWLHVEKQRLFINTLTKWLSKT
jgi:esterase